MYLPIKPDSRQLFLFEGIIKKVINFLGLNHFLKMVLLLVVDGKCEDNFNQTVDFFGFL